MRIGIGLPTVIPGVPGDTVLEWARRAERRGFGTLGVIDRIAYPNYEPLTALAAAAGATRTIGLLTDVLLGPTREPVLLAKQAASLSRLSGDRFTLGLGVGARPDDFAVVGRDFHARGRDWDAGAGGHGPCVARRSSSGDDPDQRAGDRRGWTPPAPLRRHVRRVDPAHGPLGRRLDRQQQRRRRAAGARSSGSGPRGAMRAGTASRGSPCSRTSPPATSPDDPRAADFVVDYYGPQRGPALAAGLPRTADALRAMVRRYGDMGVDEVVAFPTLPELDQIDRLADAVLG